ncbi:hypothetical protein TruAng_004358 [Truncatella angustata]|nr:hypothetical protein TruAng_004358 [Truncatella angustata]
MPSINEPSEFGEESDSNTILAKTYTAKKTRTKVSGSPTEDLRSKAASYSLNLSRVESKHRNVSTPLETIFPRYDGPSHASGRDEDDIRRIQDSCIHSEGPVQTPVKRQHRPQLHRSELQIVPSPIATNSGKTYAINDSPISPGNEVLGYSPGSESSPVSAHSIEDSSFDNTPSDSYSYATPPTSPLPTQQLSGLLMGHQGIDATSPLQKFSRHKSYTENDDEKESSSEMLENDEVLDISARTVIRKLFQERDLEKCGAPAGGERGFASVKKEKDEEDDEFCPAPAANQSPPAQVPLIPRHNLKSCKEYTKPLHKLCESMRKTIDNTSTATPGFIYCYELSTLPGHIKIGHVRMDEQKFKAQLFSAVSKSPVRACKGDEPIVMPTKVEHRLRKWAKKCGYTPRLVYWAPVVQAAWRVETFIHQQLRAHQKTESNCPGCQKGHRELFQIDRKAAQNAVDLWCYFAQTRPYQEDGSLSNAWRLRTSDWMNQKLVEPAGGLPEFLVQVREWIGEDEQIVASGGSGEDFFGRIVDG